jgi:hypothetical protein
VKIILLLRKLDCGQTQREREREREGEREREIALSSPKLMFSRIKVRCIIRIFTHVYFSNFCKAELHKPPGSLSPPESILYGGV